MKRKPGRPPKEKKPASTVMRISKKNYETIANLKTSYAKRMKMDKITFDTFLEKLFGVAAMLINGTELYRWGDKVYGSAAEARGDALQHAVRTQTVPVMPEILLFVGKDTFLSDGNE